MGNVELVTIFLIWFRVNTSASVANNLVILTEIYIVTSGCMLVISKHKRSR